MAYATPSEKYATVQRSERDDSAFKRSDNNVRPQLHKMINDALAEFDDIDQYAQSETPKLVANNSHHRLSEEIDRSQRKKTCSLARVAEDWNGDADKEQLSVKKGEILKIIEKQRTVCKCMNMAGEIGWVPTENLARTNVKRHSAH
ncbi:unnamed protein product [Anisakis simplex]|uniref:SH3 domain-containing protein n=1 Tax=Anisakis simplex TaxID=6269 RepID=A0A0M3JT24_ANISI|nr:unnamed protein product [Anisakis simplex]